MEGVASNSVCIFKNSVCSYNILIQATYLDKNIENAIESPLQNMQLNSSLLL
jgi:hypothetical protein